MGEKRLEVIDDGFSRWIIDATALYTAYDMCRNLNKLYEENRQLKKEKLN